MSRIQQSILDYIGACIPLQSALKISHKPQIGACMCPYKYIQSWLLNTYICIALYTVSSPVHPTVQVVTNRETQVTLLCLAYVFEVCTNDDGPKHHVYRLIKES